MSGTASWRQVTGDLLTPDHLPACPRCGDVLPAGATICMCGCRLLALEQAA